MTEQNQHCPGFEANKTLAEVKVKVSCVRQRNGSLFRRIGKNNKMFSLRCLYRNQKMLGERRICFSRYQLKYA